MFNLETQISIWRERMREAGIKSSAQLTELEIHLREEIQQQTQRGLNDAEAIMVAAQQIGEPDLLRDEFKKINSAPMKKPLMAGFGVVALVVGTALMVPGLVQLQHELVMANGKFSLFMAGFVLLMWSADTIWHSIRPSAPNADVKQIEMPLKTRAIKNIAGVAAVFAGLTLYAPALTQAREKGAVDFNALGLLIFGIALVIAGAMVAHFPYQRRRPCVSPQ